MNSSINRFSSQNAVYWSHIGVLISGSLVGILTAYYFNIIEFNFSRDIEEARRLGIISVTTLKGYSKSRDILTYLSVLAFPVLFSIGIWLLWMNKQRRNLLRNLLSIDEENRATRNNTSIFSLLLISILYFLFSFDINHFYVPYYTDKMGAFMFLTEEGAHLTWAQNILSGMVYGRDFSCLRGPMLVYPLAWAMKLFGETVVVERVYTYVLNLTAYSIFIFFFYKTLRHAFILSSLIYLVVFLPHSHYLPPNYTDLRVASGILPILLVYIYLKSGKFFLLPLIGILVAQSFLFSQEVGLCSLLSLVFFFFSTCFINRDIKGIIREGMLVLAGFTISVAPLLLYMYFEGALADFFVSFYGAPKIISLGFGALPSPSFERFIGDPFSGSFLLYYWPIFIYVITSIYLIPLLFLGILNRKHLLMLSLLVFGIFLFRYAVGRSDQFHLLHSSPPAFLLLFLLFDNAIDGLLHYGTGYRRGGNLLLLIMLGMSTYLLLTNESLHSSFASIKKDIFNLSQKWTVTETGYKIPGLAKGNIFLDRQTASSILKIRKFLETNTRRGDYVYFFPNEAAYYFIFDRSNPTRYAFSYQAATYEQRKEIVEDLEKKRPEYIVYSKNTWRIDGINESLQVPEIVEYLTKKYRPVMDSEDVLIAERSAL